MLIVKNLQKSFNDNLLFKNVSFSLMDKDCVAIIGLNGAGKSTLLKILLNQIDYDSGEIYFGTSPRIGWMPQTVDELNLPADMNVYDFLRSGRPLEQIQNEINQCYEKISQIGATPEILDKIGKYQEQFEYWDGYNAESELETMIDQMGVNRENLTKTIGELSGGQKSKISFIRTLYSKPNILFLDEPTNHLDAISREWMTDYLSRMNASILFISHDEDFIRKLADKILYIDAMAHNANLYKFGYDKFISVLAENNIALQEQIKKQMKKIEKIEQFIEKQKNKSGKIKRQAQSKEKMVEKMRAELPDVPPEKRQIKLDIRPKRISDIIPVSVEKLYFAYNPEHKVIKNLSFSLNQGENFVIVGENGAGKSTLLKLIYGKLTPDSGEIKIGKKTDIAYYAQEHETLNKNDTVFDSVSDECDLTTTQIRSVLNNFNFPETKLSQTIKTLSPGERSRLEIAKLCLTGANTILLDEPTNHLDVITKKTLAQSLSEYGGTIIVVSHDTEFLKLLGVERMLMLPSGKLKFFDENIIKSFSNNS